MNNYVKPLENETFEEYKIRVYKMKQLGTCTLTWVAIAQMFGETFGVFKDESRWRKEAKEFLMWDVEFATADEDEPVEVDPQEDKMTKLLLEYKKERVKLSDERIQNNAYVRRLSREDTIIEIAKNAVDKISKSKPLETTPFLDVIENTEAEAIAVISDWHYGIEVNNHWNKFNSEICVKRIKKYLGKLLQTCDLFDITKIHLVNLSDLIAGRIHATIRLESREDVISQTINVSEILAQFINELTRRGYDVEYYDCLDNHSRLEPIKSDSLELESLVRIIPWYLKERFKDEDRLIIHTNEYSDDIITFTVLDGLYNVGAVHGHKDKPQQVIKNLTLMTKENFDLILTAHLHHPALEEENNIVRISNGTLMGVDSYAKDLRLSSNPSQNIIVATKESVCDYIRVVKL